MVVVESGRNGATNKISTSTLILGPESSEVVVVVVESGQNGATNKITASALNSFFNQPAQV